MARFKSSYDSRLSTIIKYAKALGLKELDQTINLLKQTIDSSELNLIEAKGLLDVIIGYSKTWSLLQGYDENSLLINPKANQNEFVFKMIGV